MPKGKKKTDPRAMELGSLLVKARMSPREAGIKFGVPESKILSMLDEKVKVEEYYLIYLRAVTAHLK